MGRARRRVRAASGKDVTPMGSNDDHEQMSLILDAVATAAAD
ncbi:MAG TPA: hypothetical protein VGF00_08190 [Acidimicrobiia bacterium]